jgi:hypothetical protein
MSKTQWRTVIRNLGRHATPLKLYATNKSLTSLNYVLQVKKKKQNHTRSDKVKRTKKNQFGGF